MGELRVLTADLMTAVQSLIEIQHKGMDNTVSENAELYGSSKIMLITASVLAGLLALAAAFWIISGISSGLKKIQTVVGAVATGDLNQQVEIKTNDEIKDLVDSVNVMTANLRSTAHLADMIAIGDLSAEIKLLSEKDVLGIAIEKMTANLRNTAIVADQIANGDLTVSPKPASDKDYVGHCAAQHGRAPAWCRGRCPGRIRETSRPAASSCRLVRNSCRRVRQNRPPLPKKLGFDGRDGRQHQAERR